MKDMDMRNHLFVLRSFFMCGVCFIFLALPAFAQSYPAKPVRIVVGFPAGGAVDFVARLLAQRLSESLGQQFIVENRTGATGNIGAAYVAKTAPDGYTLLLSTTTTFSSGISTFKQLSFDPKRDFSPIALVVTQNNIVVVHPSAPVKNIKQLIALAKAHPGKLNYGTSGIGGMHHLRGEMFMMNTGTKLQAIHYRGGAPATNALLSGEVDLMFDTAPTALLHLKTGRVRALAVMSKQRLKMLPDVPTLLESGVNLDNVGWQGLAAPAQTPEAIVRKLNDETNKAMGSADSIRLLAGHGLDPAVGTVEDFADFINREMEIYAKTVKASGMQPQ